ncbi:hypothetical protein V4U36_000656 [Pseudomonas aeruginosa]
MRPNIVDALARLRPGAAFILVGDSYEGLDWLDKEQSKPSEDEVAQELALMEVELQATEYQRLREEEYPNKDALLIALWEMVVEGRTASAEELQALRKEIKTKYPKPEVAK